MLRPVCGGFTLIELIAALVVMSIAAAAAAVFLRAPLTVYFNVTSRGQLADAANLAVQRMTSDLATALPNSVRVSQVGASYFLEFLAVRTSGRYRNGSGGPGACPAPGDSLDFGVADTCFVTLGNMVNGIPAVPGDFVVVDNKGSGCLNDAYFSGPGGNKSQITASAGPLGGPAAPYYQIQIQSYNFPVTCQSPSQQFYVVLGPVSYECAPGPAPGGGVLIRHSNYSIAAVQPTSPFPLGTINAQLASGVTACSFAYAYNAGPPPTIATRSGTVSVSLTFTRSDPTTGNTQQEQVTVFTQLHASTAL